MNSFLQRALLIAIIFICSIGCFVNPVNGQSNYILDDGVSEGTLYRGDGDGNAFWMNSFTVLPGQDLITTISLTFGSPAAMGFSPPEGTICRVILYEDPNDDGNPNDAVYLTEASTTVQHFDMDIFTNVNIPHTQVSGVFFVAAFIEILAQDIGSGGLDQSTTPNTSSWYYFPNSDDPDIDVTDLSLTPPYQSNSNWGPWLLRATGLPAPVSTPVNVKWLFGVLAFIMLAVSVIPSLKR